MPNAHELVQRGARLLDEKLPGWADQIDLDSLVMHDGCRCVLGQLGPAVLGPAVLNLDRMTWESRTHYLKTNGTPYAQIVDAWALRDQHGLGFVVNGSDVSYDELRDAWKGEIVARRTL